MGIRRQQPGAAKAAAVAGAVIGASQKAVREQAEAAALQRQAMQIKAREAAEQRAFQWEQQKMEINSQRAFERELRVEDYKLAADDRAVERGFVAADYTAQKALERIEFGKDMEYQYSERKRTEKRDRAQAKYDQVKKHVDEGLIDPPEKSRETMSMLWDLDREINELSPRALPNAISEQRAESSETRAAEAAERAKEAHERRMADKSYSMVDKRWAVKFLADNPEPSFWRIDKAGAGSDETNAGRKMAREILGTDASIVDDATQTLNEVRAQSTETKYQQNKRTGQKRVSYDGGKTWQNL